MKPRVLLVEDDYINRLVTNKLLEKNFNLFNATNGDEALGMLENNHYDVVLMDINLGNEDLDGSKVMKIVKFDWKKANLFIYAVTSYAMPEDKANFLKEGFDRYFAKPFNKDELSKAIFEDAATLPN